MESDIVSGQQSAWVLLKKMGEGDAGEVYLVESLLEKQAAILKRPVRSPFASDIIRQTAQITTEGKILKALAAAIKMDGDVAVAVPELIDQSRPGTGYNERIFIVLEKAAGYDLTFLARTVRLGPESGTDNEAETPEEKRFLQTLAESEKLPERILLTALHSLLGLFEKIHSRLFQIDGIEAHGIVWNDVKPDHLYWDPWRARLTIIDWGNSQILERDGTSRDRRYSFSQDYQQFFDEMGRFLEMAAPELRSKLEWPHPETSDPQVIQLLRERIWDGLQQALFSLSEARDREAELLRRRPTGKSSRPASLLAKLDEIHRQIIGFGEIPDYNGALNLALSYATRAAAASRLNEVEQICEWAAGLPRSESEHLRLVNRLAQITLRADSLGATSAEHDCLSQAIHAALRRDWPDVLWSLVSALQNGVEPDWWYDLISTVRQQELGKPASDVQPLLVARRALLTLQAMAEKFERNGSEISPHSLSRLHTLIRRLREESIPNWLSTDPNPPHSTLYYQEIEEDLEEIRAFLPEAGQALERALEIPKKQSQLVLEEWNRGDFIQASEKLRQALLWDPDRKRVIRADHALSIAPLWLEKVQRGPQPGEHYQTFVMDIEYEGRELRNQVGPADWLDLILEGCRQLRRGAWPADLFQNLPLLVQEMPWLTRFERRERLPTAAQVQEPVDGSVSEGKSPGFAPINGTVRGKLGKGYDLHLTGPLDAWIAEARGSSARVFSGLLRDAQGNAQPAAIKLMRMDKVDYALPLFREEVIVLNAMHGVPGVTPLLESGFLRLDDNAALPTEREATIDPALSGSLLRIGPRSGQEFGNQIEARIAEGWTPYLAIEQRDSRENLLVMCDAMMTGGSYHPVADLLLASIQICEILQEAHHRNIVYRDHKILHYYWIEEARGVYSIDWNVAKLHPKGLSNYEKQMDLVQFGARALHHILTGRPAPGALPLGPTRPEEIEQAAKSYEAQWTYDDQRLPEDVRKILERVLAGDYNNAIQLRDELKQAFLNLPEI
jgi:serine/threonine protein kinase